MLFFLNHGNSFDLRLCHEKVKTNQTLCCKINVNVAQFLTSILNCTMLCQLENMYNTVHCSAVQFCAENCLN